MMSPLTLQRLIYRNPAVVVGVFVLTMAAALLGMTVWKATATHETMLAQAERDIQNLAHSLAEHADNTFQAPDVAMTGMAELLKYQNPLADRFHAHLVGMVRSLPQLREIGVLNTDGTWRYSSLDQLPSHSNGDRTYFIHHRDSADNSVFISGPVTSRITGRPTIVLTKRISDLQGNFAGVVIAAIDQDYFAKFYESFHTGPQGAIALMCSGGTTLVRWPAQHDRKSLSDTPLFQSRLLKSKVGFFETSSPFDGVTKYIGYEQSPKYGTVVTVARSEADILSNWRDDLKRDGFVAAVLLVAVGFMAVILAGQFRYRAGLERSLEEREERYRLLAENIADIVIVSDVKGRMRYVSHSVKVMLGIDEATLIGRFCTDLVHEDDREALARAGADLKDICGSRAVRFRTWRKNGELVWLESNFKLAQAREGGPFEIVSVLRDITEQKGLEDDLSSANQRLSQLATTDGLTGLANRRRFDSFLREAYDIHGTLSVLLIDIDHFKGFNDTLGHQAGDGCLRRIASVIGSMTMETGGLAARYGGEEFAVVLPNVAEEDAVTVADAMRLLVRKLDIVHPAAGRGYVTISVGVASKSTSSADDISLVREADIALYQAKEQGRNRTVGSSAPRRTVPAPPLVPSS